MRDHITETARAWASLGRRSGKGSPIDQYVIQPWRPLLVEMGQLGKKDNQTFINWCGMWCHAVMKASGVELPMRFGSAPLTLASCEGWFNAAKVKDALTSEPKPGDLVLFNWDKDKAPEHIGILLDWAPKRAQCETAEGNASDREAIKYRLKAMIHSMNDIEKLVG